MGSIAACSASPEPDPCAAMCVAAAELYGGCLTEWGADWEAAGYLDEADFLDACATWAWELRLLEQDAIDEGILEEAGQVDEVCLEREAAFVADGSSCSTYTSIDWNDVPWVATSEGTE